MLPAETPLKEDVEGPAKNTEVPNEKLDVSKNTEVQVAQETRNVSTGELLSLLTTLLLVQLLGHFLHC